MNSSEILQLLQQEIKPALGCTEPSAVAFAAAKTKEVLGCVPSTMQLEISGNIFKNGMGVIIPGTKKSGLALAAALGMLCGSSKNGLQLLQDIRPEDIEHAEQLVREGHISLQVKDNVNKLYIKCSSNHKEQTASVTIEERHTNITQITHNDQIISEIQQSTTNKDSAAVKSPQLSVKAIFSFCKDVPIEELSFLNEEITLNKAISKEGLTKKYGLQVGKKIAEKINNNSLSKDLLTNAMAITAAAADARMAGCSLPAMSTTGSGNQGITTSLPVIAVSEQLQIEHEKMLRGLALSNLIAIHIKSFLGQLSALCGIVIAATGASCGISYLLGGNLNTICQAINNMAGSITGMICDGAKPGCALKIASGVNAAILSALLATDGIGVLTSEGIVANDIEKTIQNIARIGTPGMNETDKLIINTMQQSCLAQHKNY